MVGTKKRGVCILTAVRIIIDDRSSIESVLRLSREFHSEARESGPFERVRVASFLVDTCDSDSGIMVVAVDKFGNRIGFVVGRSFPNYLTGQLIAEETAIYVDPHYRSEGVGDLLMDSFEDWAINKKNVKRIRVTAQASLRMAGVIRWFKSRGYKESEMSLTKEV